MQYGYTGGILRVDLSSSSVAKIPTRDYADRFIGGKGIATKIYWDEVPPEVGALDPENRLLFMTGPLAGFTGIAGSMWQIHGKSPATIPEHFCYGSLGGSWGAHLKFAGYDGIVIQGRSEKPVYLYIDDDKVQIRDASAFWGKGAVEVREALKRRLGSSARVATIGPAGENTVSFANVIADNDSSAAGGFGAVMGSKNLKAVVVRGHQKVVAAKPEELRELVAHLRRLREGMKEVEFGLIPGPKMRKQACYGCISGCSRATMVAASGEKGKYMCQSAIFYQYRAQRYYGEWNEVPFYANRLCDEYGIDTRVMETILALLVRCYYGGILTDVNTDMPLSKLGSDEFIKTLVKKISLREGFGDILAQGAIRAANAIGSEAKALVTDYIVDGSSQSFEGDPRTDVVTALLFAMEPRSHALRGSGRGRPLGRWLEWVRGVDNANVSYDVLRAISKRFFGDERAVDYSTCEGKAVVAKKIQDQWSMRESLIVCGFGWQFPDLAYSEEEKGDPVLESRVLSAVTGKETDEEQLNKSGEMIFNLDRAILAREGHQGRECDSIPEVFYTMPYKNKFRPEDPVIAPGKDGEVISRKGAVLDRQGFERAKDEYYELRQWDVASGLQTKSKLRELGLGDIIEYLEQKGLVV